MWAWTPHPKQQEFFCSPAQVRVAACGRRWGKTEALSVDIATLALDAARRGEDLRQLVVAPSETQARLLGNEVCNLLLDAEDSPLWPRGMDGRPYHQDIRQRPALQVTLLPQGMDVKSSSNDKKKRGAGPAVVRMIFRTSGRDGRSLRGLWAHRIVVDEAGYVPDQVLDEVLLPMLSDVGGELVMASSPAGRRSSYFRAFARGESAPGLEDEHGVSYQAFQCPSTDNKHIDQAWLASLREDMGESRYGQECLAQFVDDYGAVFRADDIEACIASDPTVSLVDGNLTSTPILGHLYAIGVDWGRKQDFTVVAVLDATARPARLVGLWRMQGMGWEAQAQWAGKIVAGFNPRQVLVDGNSMGDSVADQLTTAIRNIVSDGDSRPVVEKFQFTGSSKQTLVDTLTLGLSARSIVYPNHRVLLNELRSFEYQGATSSGRHRMAARGGGHDDTVMALALAWYSAPVTCQAAPSSTILLGSSISGARRDID
jgi:hypothetical protein